MGHNEISLPGLERKITLRHGWGGDLKMRNQLLLEQSRDALEARSHPFADAKFNGEHYQPCAEDRALLAKMMEAFEG